MDTRTETLLELYFANELSEAEGQELRRLIDSDPEIAAEFKWQQQIAQATRPMKLLPPERVPQTRVVPMWPSYINRAAAVITLLTAAVTIILYLLPKQSVPEAVVSHFEHYPNRMPFKSLDPTAAADVPAEVMRAFELYDDPAQHVAAAEALGAIAAKYPEHPEYRFYYGVVLTGLQKYEDASTALQQVTSSPGSYRSPALYFLGLAQSGSGQHAAARQSFERYLADPDGVAYEEQAKAMLKILPGE